MKKWLLEKRWRTVLSGTLIVTVPILGLALFVYIEVSSHLKDIIDKENRQAALNIAVHIEEELRSEIRNGGLFTTRLRLREAVRQRDRGEITSDLKNFVTNYISSVERAFVSDRKGILLADYPEDRAVIGKSFSHRDWYKGVSRSWEPYVSEFYLRLARPQKHLFAISLPIKDIDNSVIGILVLQASGNYIQEAISHIPAPKSQKVYVVDKKGNLIYHQDYQVDRIINFTGFLSVRNVINGQSGVETLKNPDGTAILTAYQPVKQWGWGVIVQRPEHEVYASLRKLTYGLFAFTAIMIAIGALLAYRRSETLFSLKKLSSELETRVEERTDELISTVELLSSEIESRRQATEALQKSEEKYRRLVDNSLVGIYKTTKSGDFIYVNKALANIYEYDSPEEMMAEGISKRYKKPKDRERLIEMLRKNGKVEQIELEFLTRTGKTKEMIMSAVIEGDTISGMLTDVTERNQAKEAILKEKAFSEAMLDSIPGIFVLFDHSGRFLRWNRVFETTSGYTAKEIAVMSPLDFFTGDGRTLIEERIGKMFETGTANAEVTFVSKDGRQTPYYFVGVRFVLDGAPCCIGIALDITERKHLEAQLRHAQKMESIGTLAGGVAHDFNNILSAIIGYGHVALMKMANDDPQRLNIEHILEAADRAAHLTKQLLLFSRKQESEQKPVDLNEIVRNVEKFLKRVIGEEIECKTIVQARRISVLADSYQLEQVLINLATNARDSMPKGGVFTVQTEEVNLDEDFIAAHGSGKAGLYALITVSDTGSSMDEATLKRIFEPFFTTKEVGKGTGLGLAVAYGIIKQHDGFINVYSEPGKGTTFRIFLPIIISAAQEETVVHREKAPAHGTETVLLAEDDDALRKLLRTALAEYGYTVIEAVDGEDAVRKFMENKEPIHILLFDLIMPKMNGKEAYDEIRKINPDLKVIFASGYAPDIVRQKASLENGAYLISKPVSPFELLKKVRGVLDGTI